MEPIMKGAQAILETLRRGGVDTLFANPGTSEMALVRALDEVPGMRAVLGLFEGVVTGAADGYARMAGRPAATLLHLGPGLANSCANLHNARRARTPLVNLIGDHATDHLALDAPLTTDVAAVARPFSCWVQSIDRPSSAGALTAAAIAAARGFGGPASLIVPADVAWSAGAEPVTSPLPASLRAPDPARLVAAAATLQKVGARTLLLLGSGALSETALAAAARLAAATGARLASETFNARAARGAGRPFAPKVPYFGEAAEAFLKDCEGVLRFGSATPVNFFGYPGRRGTPLAAGVLDLEVCGHGEDAVAALEQLCERLGAGPAPLLPSPPRPDRPVGPINAASLARAVARQLPEGTVLCEEAVTASLGLVEVLAAAAPHDCLELTGGAIGGSLPLATGAAIGAPERKVVTLSGDGSALYTVQALWTQARENLDVTTVICANRSYAILAYEHLQIEGQLPGPNAWPLLSIDRPAIDFTALAQGFGVEAVRVESAEALDDALAAAMRRRGPFLVEAVFAPMARPPAP
jgi:acetolactate synthase I/II/III large subunit